MNPHTLRHVVCAPAGDIESGGEGSTTGTMSHAKEKIAQTARETAARLKSAAGEKASRAKSEAQRLVTETKEETAQRIGGYSSAIHESARAFEQQDPNIAWVTHRAAEKLQGLADYVRDRDFAGLRVDAENLARRHPVAFFGGLFVGGLVIGNLLKARPEPASSELDESLAYGADQTSPGVEAPAGWEPNDSLNSKSGTSQAPGGSGI